jgi:hypothetical protein
VDLLHMFVRRRGVNDPAAIFNPNLW